MAESSPAWSARPAPIAPLVAARRGNAAGLPIPLTSFIGREREVATVVERLRDERVRLLTLTGPGGVGKTRLGIRAASETEADFPGGVWFVALASTRDSALVAPMIAQTLNIHEAGTRPISEGIQEFLRNHRALLLLDNFEHLLDAALLATGLLAACPALTILVTSRAVLRVSGEHDVAIPPLSLPRQAVEGSRRRAGEVVLLDSSEAVRLFLDRARAVRHDFALTEENGATIAELCRRLDGLPLAIELAAARVNHLPLPSMLRRMEQRLPLLTGGPRDQPARLRTMRAAIAWSYDLLSPAEQALFRRLAVFVGGFTLEAAEAVASRGGEAPRGRDAGKRPAPSAVRLPTPDSVLDGIASLVDESLLQQTGSEDEPRLAMLETIREFGLEQLRAHGELETAAWSPRAVPTARLPQPSSSASPRLNGT